MCDSGEGGERGRGEICRQKKDLAHNKKTIDETSSLIKGLQITYKIYVIPFLKMSY